jgi:hypothetical protein
MQEMTPPKRYTLAPRRNPVAMSPISALVATTPATTSGSREVA